MKKTAVITGASGGIGEAICRTLAGDGYNIILHCNSNRLQAESLASELKSAFAVEAAVVSADLSLDGGGKALGEKIKDITNEVDVLVNNAGVSLVGVFQCLESESIRRLLNVNLANAMELTAELLPLMINQKSGCIIMNASICGEIDSGAEFYDYDAL